MRFRHMVAASALGALALAACGTGGSYSSPSSSSKPATSVASVPMATAVPATVMTGNTPLGGVLVDSNGRTLYGFTKDVNGMSTCDGACASAWPPLTINGSTLPAGLDATIFSVITRADGSHQLKAGKWPLYRFSGDAAAGDVNGQGSGGSWFAVNPTGALHKT
jgi:predicted lipoprotein with Yx(FWY)xxD motif